MEKEMAYGKRKGRKGASTSIRNASISSIFAHADATDICLMALGTFGGVADGLSTPFTALITGNIMNDFGGFSNASGLNRNTSKNATMLFYVSAAQFFTGFLAGFCWMRTGERQASRMRARYLKAVLRQDVAYYDLQIASTADVITSVSSDSLEIQDTISEKVPNFINCCAMLVGGYTVGFFMLWRLALAALPTVLLLIIPGFLYGRILMGLAVRIREEYNTAGHIAERAISSIRTVYSFVGEGKTMNAFSSALKSSLELGIRQGLIKGISLGCSGISFAIWAFLIWYGSRLVLEHGAKGGTVFSVGTIIMSSGTQFGRGLTNMKYIAEASAAAERILNVVKRVPQIDSESMEGEMLEDVAGEVEFKAVEFAYPSRPESIILSNFSLKVPAGKTVALVGSSGSGKSTVIALLERFYDPIHGQILLDGVDIKKLKIKWFRSQMGLVSQEPILFATSVRENILFGKEDTSTEEVVRAAKAANIHEFISQLPRGYETPVGERGIQLSGGQKQRVAIARALLRSPKILLLDEATSALDSESERVVQEALSAVSVGRTTIVVAHRLSTIRNADVIAVVQSGGVAESGTHDDLMHNEGGLYAALVKLQQAPAKAKAAEIEVLASFPSAPSAEESSSSSKNSSSTNNMDQLVSSLEKKRSNNTNMRINEEEKKQARGRSHSFLRLLRLNAPEWKQAMSGCMTALMVGGVQPLYAFARGSIVAELFSKDKNEVKAKTRTHCIIFVSLALLNFLINVVQHYNFGVMGEHLTKRVREKLLGKILTFEVGWFDEEGNSTGAICSRLATDATVVRSLVGDRMAFVVQTLSALAIAYSLALITSWRLALIMIIIQPLIVLCFYTRKILRRSMSKQSIKDQAESSKLAVEAVSNIRTITIFSSQGKILGLFKQAQEGARKGSVRQSWYTGIGLGASRCIIRCTWALGFWYGWRLLANGQSNAKSVFQTIMIIVNTGRIIADLGSMSTDLTKGSDAVTSIFEILDRNTNIHPDAHDGHRPAKLMGSIDICSVDFAYPTRPEQIIFHEFSLSIEAGEAIALVGSSGSGKSTIVGLLERFYDPISGSVMIDGKDIKSYHLRELRQHIALVSQEPVLFSGTVRENIAYGAEVATEAEIEAAAKVANAHEFISSLKDGYDTWCGDRGVQLSGGQKQRIAIARAVLKDPAILLLDEATSALDSWSERLVQETLESVMVGRTSVVVAHRLSTVQNCDLIVVLQKGTVVEKGTPDSLMAKGSSGVYHALANLQQLSHQCHRDRNMLSQQP